MKIICTKLEYYSLIDRCRSNQICDCSNCALERICGASCLDEAVEFEVEGDTDG